MKAIHTSLAAALLLATSACAVERDETRLKEQRLTSGVPVALYFAEGKTGCAEVDPDTGACLNMWGRSTVQGYVEVDNLAYDKEVFVHYESADGTWKDVEASYAGPTTEGKEAWFFETEPKFHAPRLGVTFPLAIRYDVDGATYWDNNNGENYEVGAGARSLAPTRIFEAGVLDLSGAWLNPEGRLRGTVDVKNIAYDKSVELFYSVDDWQTVEVVGAEYLFFSGAWERWAFDVDLGEPTPLVEFALRYDVDGVTYWDNNFGFDYSLESGERL